MSISDLHVHRLRKVVGPHRQILCLHENLFPSPHEKIIFPPREIVFFPFREILISFSVATLSALSFGGQS